MLNAQMVNGDLSRPPNVERSAGTWVDNSATHRHNQINGDFWNDSFFLSREYPRAAVGELEEGQSMTPPFDREIPPDSFPMKKDGRKQREGEDVMVSDAPRVEKNTKEANQVQQSVKIPTGMHNIIINEHAWSPRALLSELDFKYRKLADPRMIRILKLLPGKPPDPLECILEVSSIDSEEPYEALSYVWGSKTDKVPILCQSGSLKIPRNLHDALLQLRHPSDLQRFWADAICINQECDPEKNAQVPLMRAIFKKAKKVLIWLGRYDAGHSGKTFEFARKVFKMEFDDRFRPDPSIWQGFSVLFKQSWFWRIWCFQEVVLAQEAEVLWGESRIAWEHLGLTARWIRSTGYEVIQRFALEGVSNATLMYSTSIESGTKLKSFLHLLMLTRQFESTKSVDKIYALLGIKTIDADPENGDFFLQPAYEKRTETVYEDFARKVIHSSHDMTLLSAIEHGQYLSETSKSWIPQWNRQYTRPILPAAFPVAKFSASSNLEVSPPSIQDQHLLVHGHEADTVACTSDIMPNRHVLASQQHWRVPYLWKKMVAPLQSYPNSPDLVTPFYWTLTAGKGWTGDVIDDAQSHTADFFAFVRQKLRPTLKGFPEVSDLLQSGSESAEGDAERYAEALHSSFCSRRLFVTKKGYMGIGPACMREGDNVCVLSGAAVPFILRLEGQEHKLIGEAYVHGIMHGEACPRPNSGSVELSTFYLS